MNTAHARNLHRDHGFTLIEVMISIAITLAMIIGINQVFKVATDTVSTASALSAKMRDARAAQSVFYNEFAHAVVKDAPFLIIDSRRTFAFPSDAAAKADLNGVASNIDFDGNNIDGEATVVGENIPTTATNNRSHRIDTFSFFARDLYRRQTGNSDGPQQVYVADMSANEAWVTYQHLRLYNRSTAANDEDLDANYFSPGVGTAASNPGNFYTNDWILGRNVMLLANPTDTNADGYGDEIFSRPASQGGTAPRFWLRSNTPTSLEYLEPLGKQTQASPFGGVTAPTITDGRFDLAGTTIQEFRQLLTNYIAHTANHASVGSATQLTPNFPDEWWDQLASSPKPPPAGTPRGRFRSNPYPTKPLDPRKLAQTSSAMLGHCSQFVVEYAGDFITQADAYPAATTTGDAIVGDAGAAVAVDPDGVVDFCLENGVRRVRWYGFPRDVNGDGFIYGFAAARKTNELVDVVPLRDVLRTRLGIPANFGGASFEREIDPNNAPDRLQSAADYAAPGAVAPDASYIAAWGPGDSVKPKMIRIIVTVDDPTGKLPDGQTYEYVINLPGN